MFQSTIRLKTFFSRKAVFACCITVLSILMYAHVFAAPKDTKFTVSLDQGFRHMYNLDFSAAHKTFEAWKELHPTDPLGPAGNAAAYLFSEFDRLKILEIELFVDTDRLKERPKSPDSKTKAAFEAELAQADRLAKKALDENPKDRDAMFARVLVSGLRGDYAGLIERENGSALKHFKSSRSAAQKLLSIDPNYYDAYLAIGLENYLLGIRSIPTRLILRMTGAQTNKNEGIAKLKITAEKGKYLRPYAQLLLAIAAVRESDKNTAAELLSGLAREFPANPLYRIELARL